MVYHLEISYSRPPAGSEKKTGVLSDEGLNINPSFKV